MTTVGTTRVTTEKHHRKSPNRRTSAECIAQVERLQKAIQMRKKGFGFDEIASSLGWKSRQAAQKAVAAALDRVVLDEARELKLINLMRLETAVAFVMERVEKGSLLAVDRLIRISKRQSEMLGFDESKNKDFPDGFEITIKNQSDKEKENK